MKCKRNIGELSSPTVPIGPAEALLLLERDRDCTRERLAVNDGKHRFYGAEERLMWCAHGFNSLKRCYYVRTTPGKNLRGTGSSD